MPILTLPSLGSTQPTSKGVWDALTLTSSTALISTGFFPENVSYFNPNLNNIAIIANPFENLSQFILQDSL